MGIRLQCPNGHKVHVKAFLAGKRGVCPQCGATFDIPRDIPSAAGDATGDEIATLPARGTEATGTAKLRATAPLPGPLAEPGVKLSELSADRGHPADPANFDLDAWAAAGGRSVVGGLVSGPGAKRLADRRKNAQRMRAFTLGLVVAATLLVCVLLYLVFRAQ